MPSSSSSSQQDQPTSTFPLTDFRNPRHPGRLIQLLIGPASQFGHQRGKFNSFPDPDEKRKEAFDPSPLPQHAQDRWPRILNTIASIGSRDREVVAVTMAIEGKVVRLWASANGNRPSSELKPFYEELWISLCEWKSEVRKHQELVSSDEAQRNSPESSPRIDHSARAVRTFQFNVFWEIAKHGWEKWRREMEKGGNEFREFIQNFKTKYPRPDPSSPDAQSDPIAWMYKFDDALTCAQDFLRQKTPKALAVEDAVALYSAVMKLWKWGLLLTKPSCAGKLHEWQDKKIGLHHLILKKTNFGGHLSVLHGIVHSTRMDLFFVQDPTTGESIRRELDVQELRLGPEAISTFTRDEVIASLDSIDPHGHLDTRESIITRAMEEQPEQTLHGKPPPPPKVATNLEYESEVHAEVLQICYHGQRSPKNVGPQPYPFIGISKPCCYGCQRFIQTYNELVKTDSEAAVQSKALLHSGGSSASSQPEQAAVLSPPQPPASFPFSQFAFRGCSWKPYPWALPNLTKFGFSNEFMDRLVAQLSNQIVNDYTSSSVRHGPAGSDACVASRSSGMTFPEEDDDMDYDLVQDASLKSRAR